ncbi:polyisoprenoid-binding protein [Verticiella sediminum]|uniref:Polyisoprenoid-binding protein n=1 Tax=Verticiella sediminum TaxID=1247510 RepID=A0A556B0C6_9BURK|nr:YceI family protein [Verticiella sediminum]TSH98622.1 polyisoprenoid-binding protein [Verticiella sediminum]
MKKTLLCVLFATFAGTAAAAPVTYKIDPQHTYPSFEADHLGGLSVWRGKFNRSQGSVVLDREAKEGTVQIEIDISSIDFGNDELNQHAQGAEMFDAKQFPTATYKGRFSDFDGDEPEEVEGEFTLRGVTRPLKLEIESFKCMQHPMEKVEVCGADARAKFDRGDFGLNFGLDMGFKPDVELRIQVEALREP